jgi:hypothetical protein
VGIDAATVIGKFSVRVDAAFQSRRVFFRYDLQGTTSPALQAVLSIEYQTGEPDKGAELELLYMHIFHPGSAPLLFYERNSAGAAGVFHWSIAGPLGFELRAVGGLQPWTVMLQPALFLHDGSTKLVLGATWLDGAELSFGNYFRRNKSLYLQLKQGF